MKTENINPLQNFKSMIEVHEYLEQLKNTVPQDLYELISFILGVRENEGEWVLTEIGGDKIKIDKSIANFIMALNEKSICTIASCSGLSEEHQNAKFPPNTGYLSVCKTEHNKHVLQFLTEGLDIDLDYGMTYFKPSITIRITGNDAEKKEKWDIMNIRLSTLGK